MRFTKLMKIKDEIFRFFKNSSPSFGILNSEIANYIQIMIIQDRIPIFIRLFSSIFSRPVAFLKRPIFIFV